MSSNAVKGPGPSSKASTTPRCSPTTRLINCWRARRRSTVASSRPTNASPSLSRGGAGRTADAPQSVRCRATESIRAATGIQESRRGRSLSRPGLWVFAFHPRPDACIQRKAIVRSGRHRTMPIAWKPSRASGRPRRRSAAVATTALTPRPRRARPWLWRRNDREDRTRSAPRFTIAFDGQRSCDGAGSA